MKRAVVLGMLVAAGALSIAVAAFQADQTAPVTIEKLRENLYLLPGGGGNTAAFIRSDGGGVVDTKNPGRGKDMLAKINEVTKKTRRRTWSRCGPSASSQPAPATNIFTQNNGRGLPKRSFKDRMTIGFRARTFRSWTAAMAGAVSSLPIRSQRRPRRSKTTS